MTRTPSDLNDTDAEHKQEDGLQPIMHIQRTQPQVLALKIQHTANEKNKCAQTKGDRYAFSRSIRVFAFYVLPVEHHADAAAAVQVRGEQVFWRQTDPEDVMPVGTTKRRRKHRTNKIQVIHTEALGTHQATIPTRNDEEIVRDKLIAQAKPKCNEGAIDGHRRKDRLGASSSGSSAKARTP